MVGENRRTRNLHFKAPMELFTRRRKTKATGDENENEKDHCAFEQ